MPGRSSRMTYAPKGGKGLDDDESYIQGQSCDVSVTTLNRSSLIRYLRCETYRYVSAI